MTPIRLYSGPLSMFGMKAEIALREKGVAFDHIMVPFDNSRGYAPKHAEVLRINPKGQVPVLMIDGLELYDSTQIFEYLEDAFPEPALWPSDVTARALARQLEHASDEVFFPHVIRLMGVQDDLEGETAITARAKILDWYERMEQTVATGLWLGPVYGFADIAFFMAKVFAERLGASMTSATPRLMAWRGRMMERAAVRAVMIPLVTYLRANNRFVPDFLEPGTTVRNA